MRIKVEEGNYSVMGVVQKSDKVIFTFECEKEDSCNLVMIDKMTKKKQTIPVPHEYCLGSLRSISLKGINIRDYWYYYEIKGEIVCSVLVRQIYIRKRCDYGIQDNTEHMLRETHCKIQPRRILFIHKGIDEICRSLKHTCYRKSAEPGIFRDEFIPHLAEYDEEDEICGIDCVHEGIADMHIVYQISIDRSIRHICSESVEEKDYHTAKESLISHRLCENVGKLYLLT